LKFRATEGTKVIYDKTSSNLNFDASTSDVEGTLSYHCDYKTEVTRFNLDSTGAVISDGASAGEIAGYKY
jgi:hypothetical protein